MTNNNNTSASISLTNAHGLFSGVDPEVLRRAMIATANRSIALIRYQASGCTGHSDYDWKAGEQGPLDDCNWIETLIIWIESGNHTF